MVLAKRWTCLEVEVLAGCFQMASEPIIEKDIPIILLSPIAQSVAPLPPSDRYIFECLLAHKKSRMRANPEKTLTSSSAASVHARMD